MEVHRRSHGNKYGAGGLLNPAPLNECSFPHLGGSVNAFKVSEEIAGKGFGNCHLPRINWGWMVFEQGYDMFDLKE